MELTKRKKKIFLKEIQAYDIAHETSLVRELEMEVDPILINAGYSMQFWCDCQLYVIMGALAYFENDDQNRLIRPGTLDSIKEKCTKIRDEVHLWLHKY